jgi:hypothetical protein
MLLLLLPLLVVVRPLSPRHRQLSQVKRQLCKRCDE